MPDRLLRLPVALKPLQELAYSLLRGALQRLQPVEKPKMCITGKRVKRLRNNIVLAQITQQNPKTDEVDAIPWVAVVAKRRAGEPGLDVP